MQSVIFTPWFEKQAARAGLSDDEMQEIASTIAADPLAGELMVGTGGARKLRHRRRGQGKSGGFRSIYYFGGDDVPVFLLGLIDKSSTSNLNQAERNQLASVLPGIAAAYRRRTSR